MTTFRDSDGVTRFAGDVLMGGTVGDVATVQADGTLAPASGGSQPQRNVGQCRLDFVNIGAGAITFAFGQGDTGFIDITDPANPEPIAAGIYGYTLVVSQDGGGDGGAYFATLVVDDDWYSLNAKAGHEPAAIGLGNAGADVTISVPWYCDAASPFHAAISDASADTYTGSLYVQCLAGAALG